jgi:hypothetical protein
MTQDSPTVSDTPDPGAQETDLDTPAAEKPGAPETEPETPPADKPGAD